MSNTIELKKKPSIFKRYLIILFKSQLILMFLFLILCLTVNKEMINLHKLSIENQKKSKNKNISSYNYTTLIVLSAFPLTSSLALDRFYIGNKFAVVKLLVNLFTFPFSAGVWWLIDLIKVLSCTMLDKNDKPVCKK